MYNRRSFIKAGGILLLAGMIPQRTQAVLGSGIAARKYPPVGLQAYTLRFLLGNKEHTTQDVLKQIAGMGIKELETATGSVSGLYYGHKAAEFSKMVKDFGMVWVGNHVRGVYPSKNKQTNPNGRSNLKDNLQQIVDESAEGGCSWVICANSGIANMDQIKRTTEVFSAAGEAARKSKMKFAYHNHQSEFNKIEGTSAYEYVLGQTNKDEVFMELDLAWAVLAGMDPIEMFKQYPGRFPLWHIKDADPTIKKTCAVGKGKVDFKHIYQNSKLAGVKHTFIEQDAAQSVAEVQESVDWLNKNVLKK